MRQVVLFVGVIAMLLGRLTSLSAAEVTSTRQPIARIVTYTTYGSGDVVGTLVSGMPSGCFGFWLRPSDLGFRSAYADLISTYHTSKPISVGVENTSIWAGSASPYCRLVWLDHSP